MRAYIRVVLFLLAGSVSAQSWQQIKFPAVDHLTGVSFVSPDTGFVSLSSGQIGRTNNGGRTWELIPVTPGTPLEDVDFFDSRRGAVCGRSARLLITEDGGRVWTNRSLNDTVPWLWTVQWLNDKVVLAGGATRNVEQPMSALLLRSADAGRTWTKTTDLPIGFGEFYYRRPGPVYYQSWGNLRSSHDLGQTWQQVAAPKGKPGRATGISGSTVIVAGNQGMCASSQDGGKTWTTISMSGQVNFTSIAMVSETTGFLGGTNGSIYVTRDAGKTFTREILPTTWDIFDLCLIGKTLYAVGANGTVLKHVVK